MPSSSSGVGSGDDTPSALQHWAAFVMTLGPGAAMGFYVAMVGFYVANFESRVFFIAMVFCAYVPGPIVAVLQQLLDSHFDESLSTRVTYFFRVVQLQLVLGVAALIWLLMPQMPWLVLAAGLVIGTLAQTIYSSSSQMVAVMDPGDTSFAMMGNLIGGAMPVATFAILDFGPSSSLASFRLALLTVPAICVATSLILGYFHLYLDLFEKSYARLGYDLQRHKTPSEERGMFSVEPDCQPACLERQQTETEPLAPLEDGQVPTWVWLWCAFTAMSTMLSVSVMALIAFIGRPAYAQWLSLAKLSMDLVGGVVSLLTPRLACFEQGPWHITLISVAVTRVLILVMFIKLFSGAWCPYKNKFFVHAGWLLFHVLHAIAAPHVGVTVGFYVQVQDRKRVLRMNTACRFVGAVTGIIIAAAVVVPLLGLGVNWPAMDEVVPAPGVGAAGLFFHGTGPF